MPIHIVEVSDEITVVRTAKLIVVADTVEEAEAAALSRADAFVDVEFDETQADTQPWETATLSGEDAGRLAELLEADRRPAGLDADEAREFEVLYHKLGVPHSELLKFRDEFALGTRFDAKEDADA